MTPPGTCYRLVVVGPLSQLVVDTLDVRFGPAASIRPHGDDTAIVLTADQPSLRAALSLLWDRGQELVAVLPGTGCACRTEGT